MTYPSEKFVTFTFITKPWVLWVCWRARNLVKPNQIQIFWWLSVGNSTVVTLVS